MRLKTMKRSLLSLITRVNNFTAISEVTQQNERSFLKTTTKLTEILLNPNKDEPDKENRNNFIERNNRYFLVLAYRKLG